MMNKGGRLRKAVRKSIPATFRLFLAFNFFVYGLAKVVIGQFGEVTLKSRRLPGGVCDRVGIFSVILMSMNCL